MKKLTDEMQKVYDFCVKMKEYTDEMVEITKGDYVVARLYLGRSVAYYSVKHFIEDNFIFGQKTED